MSTKIPDYKPLPATKSAPAKTTDRAVWQKMLLCHPAIVLPVVGKGKGYPVALHEGSILRVWYPGERPELTPALDWKDEQLVSYADSTGTLRFGHVRATTVFRRPTFPGVEYASIEWSGSDGTRLPVIDLLRERIALARKSTVVYVQRYRSRSHLALYRAVIREYGGRADEGDDHTALADRLMRMVLSTEALQMAKNKPEPEVEDEDETETEAPTKKTKKTKKNKKSAKPAKESASERTPMGVSLGTKLLPLLKEAGVKGAAIVTTKALVAGETPKKAALVALRDAINEAASEVREENGSLASQLSSANRTVRRLSRA